MSDVYGSTLRFFVRKTVREFRPAWLRAAPNLVMHRVAAWLEGRHLVRPALRHRWLRPVSVGLQITRHCNYRCEFCNINELVSDGDGASALTLDEFRQLLRRPLLERCARLAFTGGEPLLAADFFAIVREAKARIPIVTLNTNFSLVKRDLDQLNACGLDMINVSLYAQNQGLVQRFAPRLTERMYRRLSFVVNTRHPFHHYRRIPEVAQQAVDLGFHALYLENYLPHSPLLDHHAPRAETPDALAPVLRDDLEYAEVRRAVEARHGRQLAIAWPSFHEDGKAPNGARPQCRQPDTQIMVDRSGALGPCCILDSDARFGNVLEGDGWNSPAFVEIRRGLKVAGAPVAPACRGCPFVYKDMFDA